MERSVLSTQERQGYRGTSRGKLHTKYNRLHPWFWKGPMSSVKCKQVMKGLRLQLVFIPKPKFLWLKFSCFDSKGGKAGFTVLQWFSHGDSWTRRPHWTVWISIRCSTSFWRKAITATPLQQTKLLLLRTKDEEQEGGKCLQMYKNNFQSFLSKVKK